MELTFIHITLLSIALALITGSVARQCCIKRSHFANGLNNYRRANLLKSTAWGGIIIIIFIFLLIEFFGNHESGNLFLTFTLTENILMFFFDILLLVVAWLDFLMFNNSKFSFLDPSKYQRQHD